MSNPWGDGPGGFRRCLRCGASPVGVGRTERPGTPPLCQACDRAEAAAEGRLPVHPGWLDPARPAAWRAQIAAMDARNAAAAAKKGAAS